MDKMEQNYVNQDAEKSKEEGQRVKNRIEKLDYNETQSFFKKRAEKFKEDNPYSVTMYQDNNQALVEERNQRETETLLPLLKLNENSKVLDAACGIGRWSDAIKGNILEYCGVDFCEDLIKIAVERNSHLSNRSFLVGKINEIGKTLEKGGKGKYNCILLIGILVYLNENDVKQALSQIESVCEEHAVICVREPIGIADRLTLKHFYSEELEDNYNAIYRTRKELMQFFKEAFVKKGFELVKEDYLFSEDSLNNRKETVQYYYIFKR